MFIGTQAFRGTSSARSTMEPIVPSGIIHKPRAKQATPTELFELARLRPQEGRSEPPDVGCYEAILCTVTGAGSKCIPLARFSILSHSRTHEPSRPS
jgi:hypothetical protein